VLSTIQPDHFDAQATRHGIRQYFAKAYVGVNDKRETILSLSKKIGSIPSRHCWLAIWCMIWSSAARWFDGGRRATGFIPIEKLVAGDPDAVVRDLILLRRLLETNEINTSEEWIEIVDLEVKSKIGVPNDERSTFQRLLVSLRFQIESGFEELRDRFASRLTMLLWPMKRAEIAEAMSGCWWRR